MTDFLQGATSLASIGVALFFYKYWRTTRDRLFITFSIAFTVFAVNRVLLSVLDEESEARTWVYVGRAVTFLLIVAAVVDKNYGPRRRNRDVPPRAEVPR